MLRSPGFFMGKDRLTLVFLCPWHKCAGRLEAMLLEAKGSWAEAEKAYLSLLEDNPLDQVSFTLA